MNLRLSLALAGGLLLPAAAHAQLVDSVNANATPDFGTTFGATNYGWLFTPTTSYTVGNIQTKFATGSQPVTLVVFDGLPNGAPLATGNFVAQPNVFSGATLSTPLQFAAGHTYFIGFENVAGLGVNLTSDNGAQTVDQMYLGFNPGDFSNPVQPNGYDEQVILEFFTALLPPGTNFAGTPGLTPNQGSIAANVDFNSVAASPQLAAVIAGLLNVSPTEVPGALNQLSPVQFGQFASSTAINNATFASEQRDQYLNGQRTGPNGTFAGGNGSIDSSRLTVNDPSYDPGLAMIHSRMLAWNAAPFGAISDSTGALLGGIDMKDMKKCSTCAVPEQPWNVFVEGNVVLAQGFSQDDVAHFDGNTESVTIGADYRFTKNFLAGLTAGYGHTDATLDPNGSSATTDSYSPGFYASYADKGWYANLTGAYLHNAYTQSRVISFLGQTANSAPEGNEGTASLDGGYDFHSGAWTFGPLAGVQYTHLSVDGYTESGSDAALTVASQDADSLRSRLGGRVSYDYKHCGLTFTPHLDASWLHEFMDQARGITSQFNGGLGSFNVRTPNPSRDSALVDAGLDVQVNEMITAFGDYVVQAGQDNYFGQSIEAGLKIGF